jgi:hypothetical protein
MLDLHPISLVLGSILGANLGVIIMAILSERNE